MGMGGSVLRRRRGMVEMKWGCDVWSIDESVLVNRSE